MSQGVMLALVCGVIAVLFGGLWAKTILAMPDGNALKAKDPGNAKRET